MRVVIDKWAWLPKHELDFPTVARVKSFLTVHPRTYSPSGVSAEVEPIKLYVDAPEYLGVARQYFLDRKRPDTDIDDNTTRGNRKLWGGPVEVAKGMAPREEQARALDAVEAKARNPLFYGGILQAAPGWGKTAFSAFLIARLKMPTLVVVHKDFLLNQWVERMRQFLDAPKIGTIKQATCDFSGKQVVVAMVQSLVAREYPKPLYDWPGMVIFDEVHRAPARTWVKAITLFRARYRFGLTATPRRADGAEAAFFEHIGPIIFRASERRLKPMVKRVWTGFRPKGSAVRICKGSNKALILRFVCASTERNRLIVSQMHRAAKAGRKLLVLSDRLKHLEALKMMFERGWPTEDLGGCPSTAMYVGSTSKADREEAIKADVIFATTQLVSEGFDVPPLDTLFLTTPISDVEQAVGRILRPHPGKKDPVVVDFRDDAIPLFERMGQKRDTFYAKIA